MSVRWLKSHTNCPICRKDLEDGDDQQQAPAPPASCAVNAPDVLQQQVSRCVTGVAVEIVCVWCSLCCWGVHIRAFAAGLCCQLPAATEQQGSSSSNDQPCYRMRWPSVLYTQLCVKSTHCWARPVINHWLADVASLDSVCRSICQSWASG